VTFGSNGAEFFSATTVVEGGIVFLSQTRLRSAGLPRLFGLMNGNGLASEVFPGQQVLTFSHLARARRTARNVPLRRNSMLVGPFIAKLFPPHAAREVQVSRLEYAKPTPGKLSANIDGARNGTGRGSRRKVSQAR